MLMKIIFQCHTPPRHLMEQRNLTTVRLRRVLFPPLCQTQAVLHPIQPLQRLNLPLLIVVMLIRETKQLVMQTVLLTGLKRTNQVLQEKTEPVVRR